MKIKIKTRSVETRDLTPGMVIAFTKHEVISHPTSLTNTPKGKVEFAVKTKDGAIISKCWHRNTLVAILTDET